MPNQAMYGQLRDGKRPACKPRKHIKDCQKDSFNKAYVNTHMWEKKAKDTDGWRGEIVQAVKGFEGRRIENAVVKRSAMNMEELTLLPGRGSKEVMTCNICGRICISKAIHIKSHQNVPNDVPYDNLDNFSCTNCVKVCRNSSGLTKHFKSKQPDEPVASN